MITIGDFDIISVQTGTIRLDGGSMFGVVPKALWQGHEDVDDDNRILLATRTLVAVSHDKKTVILVDTGNGTKWDEKSAARFAIQHDADAIVNALEQWDLSAADVTDVIATHLHFDHNGGLTEWADEPGGKTKLVFPNAKHWIHAGHWQHANNPSEKDRASFIRHDFDILESTGVLQLVEGESPSAPWNGVRFMLSSGHTPCQLLPVFFDDEHELIWTGDAIPTSSHLRVPWVMAYDNEPLKTIAEKKAVYDRVRERGSWLAFPHDHRLGGGVIDFAKDKPFVAKPLDM